MGRDVGLHIKGELTRGWGILDCVAVGLSVVAVSLEPASTRVAEGDVKEARLFLPF